jgi:hypothetical protein
LANLLQISNHGKLCTSADLDEIQNEVTLSRLVLLFYEMIEFYWTNIEKDKEVEIASN